MSGDDTGCMTTTGATQSTKVPAQRSATNRPSLISSAIAELRARRAAREQHKQLVRELSSYTSAADLDDLNAILSRYDDDQVEPIRRILNQVHAA